MTHQTIDISESDSTLQELLQRYGPRASLTVKKDGRIVGRFEMEPGKEEPAPRKSMLGLHEGNILSISDGFNDPLPDEFWLSGDP